MRKSNLIFALVLLGQLCALRSFAFFDKNNSLFNSFKTSVVLEDSLPVKWKKNSIVLPLTTLPRGVVSIGLEREMSKWVSLETRLGFTYKYDCFHKFYASEFIKFVPEESRNLGLLYDYVEPGKIKPGLFFQFSPKLYFVQSSNRPFFSISYLYAQHIINGNFTTEIDFRVDSVNLIKKTVFNPITAKVNRHELMLVLGVKNRFRFFDLEYSFSAGIAQTSYEQVSFYYKNTLTQQVYVYDFDPINSYIEGYDSMEYMYAKVDGKRSSYIHPNFRFSIVFGLRY